MKHADAPAAANKLQPNKFIAAPPSKQILERKP